MNKRLCIIGASGFGREVLWLAREFNKTNPENSYNEIVFVDDNKQLHGTEICDVKIVGGVDWLKYNPIPCICAIGAPRVRRKVIAKLEKFGATFETIIHPDVRMSEYVSIGEGTVICSGSILTTQINIGNHVHVNLNCTVGHDVVIEDFSTIAPGVNISGNVNVMMGADMGTNSTVIQGLKIGKGAVIGAGAVVNKDIPDNCVAVGIPARKIKDIEESI